MVKSIWRSFHVWPGVSVMIALVIVLAGSGALPAVAQGNVSTVPAFTLASKAAVVIEAASGKVLYEHNAHQALPPASVTKVMTMLLALEAVDAGLVSLDDIVTTSARARSMGGTQIWLETGEQMPFGEMLWAIAVGSANDASVAIAEHLAGSESAFAELMNERARELGAMNTHFLNASGLPPRDVGLTGEHTVSVYDLALMSQEAMKYPLFREMVSTWGPVVMRPHGSRVPELFTYNRMLRTYPGMDGIKTGFTSEAGYGISATALKDGVRVIVVTLGAQSTQARDEDVRRLLDYGFSRLRPMRLHAAGDVIQTVRVPWGEPTTLDVTLQNDLIVTLLRDAAEQPLTSVIWDETALEPPFETGQTVGRLIVYVDDVEVAEGMLVAAHDVQRTNWMQQVLRNARRILSRDM